MAKPLKLSTIRTLLLALILLVIGGGVGYYYGKGDLKVNARQGVPQLLVNSQVPSEYETVDFSLFWHVWEKIEAEHLEGSQVDRQEMVYGAIQGMVSALDDPYTVFLPPEEQQRSTEDLSGAFEGVGIQLGYIDNQIGVMAPIKGMPAEQAGVLAGDLILNIKDEEKNIDVDTQGLTLPEAVNIIRGEHGKPVTLTLYRPEGESNQPFDVTINRDTIVVPSVELTFVEQENKKIAHLSLFRFGGRTEEEWNQAVSEILENDVDGVVLDLRNNPGGYLNGAIFIASEFIDSGVVVRQQGKYNTETFSVNRKGRLVGMPVSILINKGSASASEIVAGALRDRIGAPLVGTQSFGKGTVQNAEELPGGSGLHVTVARWLLPGGDWIHESGIAPDVEATDSAQTEQDEMLDAAINQL